MPTEDLTFIGSDPGAVKYGNFINYYSFHSTKERINNLHPQIFPTSTPEGPILCLDIGCNTGELSIELYSYLKSTIYPNCDIQMLAVDIDPNLIDRAKQSNDVPNITFAVANVMEPMDKNIIQKYLDVHQRQRFDITYCFSVTMWIHINNGDEGLEQFINYIKDVSKTIVIEPQPWNCYRNAQRRVKKSGSTFPLYQSLKIRSNVDAYIENIIQNTHAKVYESPASNWKRKIQSFSLRC